jgi:hypothetical protein
MGVDATCVQRLQYHSTLALIGSAPHPLLGAVLYALCAHDAARFITPSNHAVDVMAVRVG